MSKKLGKRIAEAKKLVDGEKTYSLSDALLILNKYKEQHKPKFDESLDAVFCLGIDGKKSDQNVRGFCVLPNGNGKKVKLLVFTTGNNIDIALAAGATHAGGEDMIEQVKNGFMDFDKCIATQDMMPKLATIAKILGPKGLMPNIKLGTVTSDIAETVSSMLKGRVEFRADKAGVLATSIGRLSFDDKAIKENLVELFKNVKTAKPAAVKSNYLKSLYLSPSMGPSIKVAIGDVA